MKRIITIALLSELAIAARYSNPKRTVEPVYYRGQCQNNIGAVGSLLVVTEVDQEKTETACNQLGGQLCDLGCVVTGDKKTPNLTHASWKEACKAAGADEDDLFGRDHLTQEDIEDFAGC
jgi:hypothetical protein